jgi:predicted Rossmann fold flavoprotein
MEKEADIIIVGAGASGLAAAVEAARAGARVLVLEKNHVPGRKVLSTGSGKCNFSNLEVGPADYNAPARPFIRKALAALPPAEVRAFFEGLGLLWSEGENGRLFPRSLRAQDVVALLVNELAFRGGRVATLAEVHEIKAAAGGFEVRARKVPPKWDKKASGGDPVVLRARRVILAAGGAAYPQIGGGEGGYALLKSLGHEVSSLSPSIVPLRTLKPPPKELDGVRLAAALELISGDRVLAESAGELLFTSYGLSGPAVLDLSRAAVAALGADPVSIDADFFPEITAPALEKTLESRARAFAGRPFSHFAAGLLNDKVLKAAAARAGIIWDAPVGPVQAFARELKNFAAGVAGPLGFEDAMVTAGGCALAEIAPATFASKKTPGLYVTGELLDVDGRSGGFNLHFAWTSGILAGRAAARF